MIEFHKVEVFGAVIVALINNVRMIILEIVNAEPCSRDSSPWISRIAEALSVEDRLEID
jgi:hypothetical protein